MVLLAYITASYWLDLIPLDPDFADMLPIMKVMNERFLHGDWKQVYDPITEIWNGTRPIYLPAMWIPYAPAVALRVGYALDYSHCAFAQLFGCFNDDPY